jgi:DNA-binding PucR family transcriptional regulator
MELQDIVDDLAALLQRPVEVEDRRWRLLAHSAHEADDPADRVRTATILTRRAPPAVAAWLDSLQLERAQGISEVPPNTELAMEARVCVPLRRHNLVLGYLWVIPGGRTLADGDRAAIEHAAADATEVLWTRRQRVQDRAALVEDLLAGGAAATAAAAALGWAPGASVRVVAARGAADDLAATIGRQRRGRMTAVGHRGGVIVVVAPVSPDEPPAALAAIVATTTGRAGASAPIADLAGLSHALDQARAALRALEAEPSLGTAGAYEQLGAWPLLAELAARAEDLPTPDVVARLASARGGDALLSAAAAFLDAAGDVSAAASALHVHRVTLYRRLERVSELTGLDLRNGEDRLLLHVALRLARLQRST